MRQAATTSPPNASSLAARRTIKNLIQAVRQADLAMLYDSGSPPAPDGVNSPVRVAVCRGRETKMLVANLSGWATTVLG